MFSGASDTFTQNSVFWIDNSKYVNITNYNSSNETQQGNFQGAAFNIRNTHHVSIHSKEGSELEYDSAQFNFSNINNIQNCFGICSSKLNFGIKYSA